MPKRKLESWIGLALDYWISNGGGCIDIEGYDHVSLWFEVMENVRPDGGCGEYPNRFALWED